MFPQTEAEQDTRRRAGHGWQIVLAVVLIVCIAAVTLVSR
jgi:hypothetical protein